MQSPKSRQHKEKRESHVRRKHSNKKFYNSKAWRDTRAAYLRQYQKEIYECVLQGEWRGMELSEHQKGYILSLSFIPCETCLRHYATEAYNAVEPGKELDHIEPVNPENAILSEGYGCPFDFNNLQYLCKRHHSKKSQRERN